MHVAETTLPREVAHVGQARRLLMDQACERLRAARRGQPAGGAVRGVVLSTDGDSFVAPDWIARTLAEIDAGADAVGGRILCDARRSGDPALHRWQRLDAIHRLLCLRLAALIDPDPADPWPRHHQHFGASLAVAADAYERVGGLPAVRFLEDEALHRRLSRADLRVRHSPQVRVYTSSRHDGRVEVGLSWQLRTWARSAAGGAAGLRVDAAAEVVALAEARRRLRRLWLDRRDAPGGAPRGLRGVARALRVPADWLRTVLHEAAAFGALWGEVEQQRAARRPRRRAAQVPVEAAIDELKRLIGERLAAAGHGRAVRPAQPVRTASPAGPLSPASPMPACAVPPASVSPVPVSVARAASVLPGLPPLPVASMASMAPVLPVVSALPVPSALPAMATTPVVRAASATSTAPHAARNRADADADADAADVATGTPRRSPAAPRAARDRADACGG